MTFSSVVNSLLGCSVINILWGFFEVGQLLYAPFHAPYWVMHSLVHGTKFSLQYISSCITWLTLLLKWFQRISQLFMWWVLCGFYHLYVYIFKYSTTLYALNEATLIPWKLYVFPHWANDVIQVYASLICNGVCLNQT